MWVDDRDGVGVDDIKFLVKLETAGLWNVVDDDTAGWLSFCIMRVTAKEEDYGYS